MNSILITGSNRGLGLGLIKQLLNSNKPTKHIFATCRQPEKAQVTSLIFSNCHSGHKFNKWTLIGSNQTRLNIHILAPNNTKFYVNKNDFTVWTHTKYKNQSTFYTLDEKKRIVQEKNQVGNHIYIKMLYNKSLTYDWLVPYFKLNEISGISVWKKNRFNLILICLFVVSKRIEFSQMGGRINFFLLDSRCTVRCFNAVLNYTAFG